MMDTKKEETKTVTPKMATRVIELGKAFPIGDLEIPPIAKAHLQRAFISLREACVFLDGLSVLYPLATKAFIMVFAKDCSDFRKNVAMAAYYSVMDNVEVDHQIVSSWEDNIAILTLQWLRGVNLGTRSVEATESSMDSTTEEILPPLEALDDVGSTKDSMEDSMEDVIKDTQSSIGEYPMVKPEEIQEQTKTGRKRKADYKSRPK